MVRRVSKKRSWAKTATWRFIAVVIIFAVAYILTDDLGESTIITIFSQAIKTLGYYIHERAWAKTDWGIEK